MQHGQSDMCCGGTTVRAVCPYHGPGSEPTPVEDWAARKDTLLSGARLTVTPQGATIIQHGYTPNAQNVKRAPYHAVAVPQVSTKKQIERLCAEGRLAGIEIHDVKVDLAAWRELDRDLGRAALVGSSGEPIHVVNTCNGPCVVRLA